MRGECAMQMELVARSHLGTARLTVQHGTVHVELCGRGVCVTGDEVAIVREEDTVRLVVRERGCVALLLTGVDIVRLCPPFVLKAVPSGELDDALPKEPALQGVLA